MSEPTFRILVTDDEEQMRDLLVSNLEKEGYETVTATNGLEAIDSIERTVVPPRAARRDDA